MARSQFVVCFTLVTPLRGLGQGLSYPKDFIFTQHFLRPLIPLLLLYSSHNVCVSLSLMFPVSPVSRTIFQCSDPVSCVPFLQSS